MPRPAFSLRCPCGENGSVTAVDNGYTMHFQIGDITMKINYYPDLDSLYVSNAQKKELGMC